MRRKSMLHEQTSVLLMSETFQFLSLRWPNNRKSCGEWRAYLRWPARWSCGGGRGGRASGQAHALPPRPRLRRPPCPAKSSGRTGGEIVRKNKKGTALSMARCHNVKPLNRTWRRKTLTPCQNGYFLFKKSGNVKKKGT